MIGISETLITQQSDGAAITAAARTSLLTAQAKKTINANTFNYIGQTVKVIATGRISSVITTPGTARFDFSLGASVVFDGLAALLDTVAAKVTVGWKLELDLTLRATGSTASFFGFGLWTCDDLLGRPAGTPVGVLAAVLPWNTAPAVGATFDATVSNVADLFFTQTVATGTCTCHTYQLILPNGY